jgi:hypothetical protein
MADKAAIAKAFCTAYFSAMSTDRSTIGKFYRERSTLTFQGQEFVGVAAIQTKLNALGSSDGVPAKIEYKITKCDVQVSKAPNSLVMLLLGQLKIDGAESIGWAQFVHLTTEDAKQWYIYNDIFRLSVD